jgi:DNA invertase Pin-like site-specific DNA recombinase
MRVVAYLRLSVDDPKAVGLDAQRCDIDRWATARGHEIVGWLSDIGSGDKPDLLE